MFFSSSEKKDYKLVKANYKLRIKTIKIGCISVLALNLENDLLYIGI